MPLAVSPEVGVIFQCLFSTDHSRVITIISGIVLQLSHSNRRVMIYQLKDKHTIDELVKKKQ